MPAVFSLLLLLFFSTPAVAQEPTLGVWAGQLTTLDLNAERPAGVHLWLDLHERQIPGQFMAIVRPGVGWNTGKGLSVWGGYGWIPTWDGENQANEHRIWQQAIYKRSLGPVGLMGRLRLEQRLVDGASRMGHRTRLFARSGLAFSDTYGLSLWDEVFIHLNNTTFSTPGLNQNRLFVGPYIKASAGFRTEFGYLNLLVNTGDDLRVSHILAMNLFIPFKLGA